jgi:hypothetical protein
MRPVLMLIGTLHTVYSDPYHPDLADSGNQTTHKSWVEIHEDHGSFRQANHRVPFALAAVGIMALLAFCIVVSNRKKHKAQLREMEVAKHRSVVLAGGQQTNTMEHGAAPDLTVEIELPAFLRDGLKTNQELNSQQRVQFTEAQSEGTPTTQQLPASKARPRPRRPSMPYNSSPVQPATNQPRLPAGNGSRGVGIRKGSSEMGNGHNEPKLDCSPQESKRRLSLYDDKYVQSLLVRTPSPPVKEAPGESKPYEEKEEEEQEEEQHTETSRGERSSSIVEVYSLSETAEEEKAVSMDDDWWSADNVSAAEEAAVTQAALDARGVPMDTSAFAVGQKKR